MFVSNVHGLQNRVNYTLDSVFEILICGHNFLVWESVTQAEIFIERHMKSCATVPSNHDEIIHGPLYTEGSTEPEAGGSSDI